MPDVNIRIFLIWLLSPAKIYNFAKIIQIDTVFVNVSKLFGRSQTTVSKGILNLVQSKGGVCLFVYSSITYFYQENAGTCRLLLDKGWQC